MRRSRSYVIYYHTWVWGFLTGFIPVVGLIFLNSRIYLAMQILKCGLAGRKSTRLNKEKGVGASVSTESSSSRTTSRASQQRRDCNLSTILIVTVVMFLIFHSPRIIVSMIESFAIQSVVHCTERGL